MRNFTIVLLTTFCTICGHFGYSQESLHYSNKHLAELWSDLSADINQLKQDNLFDYRYNYQTKGYSIIAEIHNENILTHLGIDIFGGEIKEFQDKLILDFTERYLLELLLEESDENRKAKAEIDMVTLSGNINNIPISIVQ